ncbi:MAG: Gldg family protein [Pirellulales bacterium]
MKLNVLLAVFWRNFTSYFSSPVGYVFITVFVLLSSAAAFWTPEFFNSNLANLDQLNTYFPYIMLVFVPAITMSIWAEERRQGTDELLLTLPASDFDVVFGKFFAALAIYSVSLLFSFFTSLIVLASLGTPDFGLFLATYFGYWMIGMAMISVGMIGSFLTANVTVAFVLGALFNVPLVFAGSLEGVRFLPLAVTDFVTTWSIGEQSRDFFGGVISFSAVAYFFLLTAVMLYACMILIGRRHWLGGRDNASMGPHYLGRFLALLVIVASVSVLLGRYNLFRLDMTSEQLSSLSGDSVAFLNDFDPEFPVKIEAFVSRDLPEEFVRKRFDLVSALREIDSIAGDKVEVRIREVDLFSDEAARAEDKYGIESQEVETKIRGARTRKDIIFGLGVTSGLQKVVVPFLGKGLPVEYELIRSIATVEDSQRKTVGVLQTGVELLGGDGPGNDNEQAIITELRKQYEVVAVDPNEPITDSYAVLLAPQPSMLSAPAMKNFVDAVKRGQPTAIFEDPFPYLDNRVRGTGRPDMRAMMMGMPPQDPNVINQLWEALGVSLVTATGESSSQFSPPQESPAIAWQDYDPSPVFGSFVTPQWVFASPASGADDAFNPNNSAVSGFQKALFLFPGGLRSTGSVVNREIEPLVKTNDDSGVIAYSGLIDEPIPGMARMKNPSEIREQQEKTDGQVWLAAYIHTDGNGAANASAGAAAADGGISAVVVADIDILYSVFFALRERGDDPDDVVRWDLDNVPLVLNIIDFLAGEQQFLNIRKRRPQHRELERLREINASFKQERDQAREKSDEGFNEAMDAERKRLEQVLDELRSRQGLTSQQAAQELMIAGAAGEERLEARRRQLERKQQQEIRDIDRRMAEKTRDVQDTIKTLAVVLPPIPPLLIAIIVFFARRRGESEGVSSERRV